MRIASRARHVVFSTLVVLLISASAYAQAKVAKSVLDNYDKGVSAVKAGKWQEAIAPLQAAVTADPIPRTVREGVLTNDYYPQLYLFEAYVKLGDFVNANKYYAIRGAVPAGLVSQMKPFADSLTTENARVAKTNTDKAAADKAAADKAIADKAAADKAASDKAAADKAAADKVAEDKRLADKAAADKAAADKATADKRNADLAEFNKSVTAGNNAYNAKNWGGAVDAFTQAKNRLPSDFSSAPGGLEGKLRDASQKKADTDFFESAVRTADASLGQKNYADAVTGYTNAKNRNLAEFTNRKLQAKLDLASTGLKQMGADAAKKAELDSMVRTANSSLTNKKWDDAIAGYGSVKSKFPAEFQQQNLQAKIDEALKGKTGAALADKAAADKAAADRAAADRLAAEKLAEKNAPSADKLAHDGLVALVGGDATKATSLLEQAKAAAAKSKPALRATVAAYLGVAYAMQSIQKNDKSLEAQAKQQFKDAQQLQRGYELSDRVVSPQVKRILTGSDH